MRTRGFFLKSAKQFQSWYHLVELHIQTLVSHFSHWRHSQYCQWTVGHYLLYFKVLLWTSLMCFKIVSFHWLCKDLQGTSLSVLHCSCLNVREKGLRLCGVSILLPQGKDRQTKRRCSGMAWLLPDGQIWDGAEWTEEHRRSHLTASWVMNLILNNHHAFSHTNFLLYFQARMMLSEGHWSKDWD